MALSDNISSDVGASNADAVDSQGRSAQSYIDETPFWKEGTPTASASLTGMQWTIWFLAASAKFFEGLIVFMTGVAMPLISNEFGLSALQHGLLGAATLFGILIGALFLGGLSDHFGRKPVFIAEMGVLVLFLVLLSISPNFVWLLIALFGVGLMLGCDYPTGHLVISEAIPSRNRGSMVLSAFGFQAIGALLGAVVGFLILSIVPEVWAWRYMYAVVIIPALVVFLARFKVTESPSWLLAHGREEKAEKQLVRLLKRHPQYPTAVKLKLPQEKAVKHKGGYADLFKGRNLRSTIFASVPWLLQDLGTYGIGIFTPTILAATVGVATAHHRNVADLVASDIYAAKGSALLDILFIFGIIAAVLLADRVGRIWLQIVGFIGCALGLFIAALSTGYTGGTQMTLIFVGFMLFNFMTNMGPNAQTYLLAGEVFPVHIRARGAGFAAGFAKIGAVTTAFLFPILLQHIGMSWLFTILIVTSLLGAIITWSFRVETRGRSLDNME